MILLIKLRDFKCRILTDIVHIYEMELGQLLKFITIGCRRVTYGAQSSLAKAEVVSRKCGVNSIHVFLNHHYQSLEILSLNCVGRVLWLAILCNHTCLICHEGGTIIHPNRHYTYIYPIGRHQLQDELVRHCKPNIKSQHVYWNIGLTGRWKIVWKALVSPKL